MLIDPIADVAIGLAFVFMTISLAAAAVTEAIASALKWRQSTLLGGIKSLLNDEKFTGLALDLYNHTLVNPLANTVATDIKDLSNKPAYIKGEQFAAAVVNIIQTKPAGARTLKQSVDSITDPQLKQTLSALLLEAKEDQDLFRAAIGRWFDSGMDRLSGAYKRRSQLVGFIVALAIAGLLNANPIGITHSIWTSPAIRASIADVKFDSNKPDDAKAWIKTLESASILGWSNEDLERDAISDWFWRIVGFLMVAVASLLGAPFWYDTLQRVTQIAGTGPAPSKK